MEELLNTGSTKRANKSLDNRKAWIMKLQNVDGQYVTSRKELLSVASTFYEDLYKDDESSDKPNITVPPTTTEKEKITNYTI